MTMIDLQSILPVIYFVGLGLKMCGFLIRDELKLRLLVAMGLLCDLLFYSLIDTRIILPIASTALLASINIVLLVLIVFERTTWRMSVADKALFAHFTTLTPGQFRRLPRCQIGQRAGGLPFAGQGCAGGHIQPFTHLDHCMGQWRCHQGETVTQHRHISNQAAVRRMIPDTAPRRQCPRCCRCQIPAARAWWGPIKSKWQRVRGWRRTGQTPNHLPCLGNSANMRVGNVVVGKTVQRTMSQRHLRADDA